MAREVSEARQAEIAAYKGLNLFDAVTQQTNWATERGFPWQKAIEQGLQFALRADPKPSQNVRYGQAEEVLASDPEFADAAVGIESIRKLLSDFYAGHENGSPDEKVHEDELGELLGRMVINTNPHLRPGEVAAWVAWGTRYLGSQVNFLAGPVDTYIFPIPEEGGGGLAVRTVAENVSDRMDVAVQRGLTSRRPGSLWTGEVYVFIPPQDFSNLRAKLGKE